MYYIYIYIYIYMMQDLDGDELERTQTHHRRRTAVFLRGTIRYRALERLRATVPGNGRGCICIWLYSG